MLPFANEVQMSGLLHGQHQLSIYAFVLSQKEQITRTSKDKLLSEMIELPRYIVGRLNQLTHGSALDLNPSMRLHKVGTRCAGTPSLRQSLGDKCLQRRPARYRDTQAF